jgi:AraC-like DNA-binding protein
MSLNRIERVLKRAPVFEQIVTGERETFLWRCDDYPWERNVWNVHPEFEIHLVRYVAGVALVGDHIAPFEPGHLTLVGSGLPHDWVTTLPPGALVQGRDIVVQFHPDRLRRAAGVLPELADLEPLLGRAMRGLAFHGETRRRGAALMEAMGATDGVARLGLFLELLQLLASDGAAQVLSSADFVPATDRGTVDAIGAALAFIVENFRSDIRLADLAGLLGQSEWACSRFFKKNSGNTFSDYLTMLRIGAACKLLADSEMPVTDICFDVGYSNVSNFNRVFRVRRGMTPSAYRRLARRRQVTAPNRPGAASDAILRA